MFLIHACHNELWLHGFFDVLQRAGMRKTKTYDIGLVGEDC